MNRVIKFRRPYFSYKDGSFVCFKEWVPIDGGFISPASIRSAQGGKDQEFTGLLDRNGKEIWEGDLFQFHDSCNDKPTTIGVVRFFEGYFDVEVNGSGRPWVWDDYSRSRGEVIGNIYENPDLLPVREGTS